MYVGPLHSPQHRPRHFPPGSFQRPPPEGAQNFDGGLAGNLLHGGHLRPREQLNAVDLKVDLDNLFHAGRRQPRTNARTWNTT